LSERSVPRVPIGSIESYAREPFSHDGIRHDVYRKGRGPAVVVLTEVPDLSVQVLGFADKVVALGCSVALPHMFGRAGANPMSSGRASYLLHGAKTISQLCVSREFNLFVSGRASPITGWLRALAAYEHARCGGPGVGVVGMCFTGGFALAMASDPHVLAPVLSQPSLPVGTGYGIDSDPETVAQVAQRCAKEDLKVLGLRFEGDPFVPSKRFQYLRDQLGDGFVAVELPQSAGHPRGPLLAHHSVLTLDLIDAPGEPTRAALDQVLDLFRTKLLGRTR
jgi:dienelactone hydrolase